jgi:GTP cyclohydrolase I
MVCSQTTNARIINSTSTRLFKEHLKCESVAVSISSKHTCCGLRGVKHPESVMTTNSFSGKFMEPNNLVTRRIYASY